MRFSVSPQASFQRMVVDSSSVDTIISSDSGYGLTTRLEKDITQSLTVYGSYSVNRIHLKAPTGMVLTQSSEHLQSFEVGAMTRMSKIPLRFTLAGAVEEQFRASTATSSQVDIVKYRSPRAKASLMYRLISFGSALNFDLEAGGAYLIKYKDHDYTANKGWQSFGRVRLGSSFLSGFMTYRMEKQSDSSYSYTRKSIDFGIQAGLHF